VKNLREKITLLKLINDLNLSRDQAEPIIRLARARERLEPPDLLTGNWQTRASRDYRKSLEEMLRAVENGEVLKPEDEHLLQRRREQARLVEMRERGLSATARTATLSLDERVALVRSSLTDEQKQRLLEFNPSLFPTRDVTDLDQTGQTRDPARERKLLEKVRNVPDDDWEGSRPKIIDDVFDDLKTMGRELPEDQAAEYRQRLAELLDRVKAMDEEDYNLSETKLARELESLDWRPKLARQKIRSDENEQVLDAQIRALILNPKAADLLEKRQIR